MPYGGIDIEQFIDEYFTRTNILKLNGFNKIHVTKTFNYFTLRHIVDVATSVIGFGGLISKLCPNVTIRLKFGNIATFAQKTDLVA